MVRSLSSSSTVQGGSWVWVPNKTQVFKRGQIIETVGDNKVKVRYEDGTDEEVSSGVIGEVNPSKFDKADDIAELTFLNEPSVLHNLDMRYKDDLIYTYSGLFLVAINPYNKLQIYGDDHVNMYHNVPKNDTRPHIFAETELAYQKLLKDKRDQSILVTGESGAGKTENTKKIIQYLAAITSKHNKNTDSFEEQIIQANPILEAFGNSQTVRNNNSSRFGKFIKIEFDDKGKIAGAHIDWYLLEKSRVTKQSKGERNYHVFYQLLNGLTEKELELLHLKKSPTNYNYLKDGNVTVPGVDDKKEFRVLMNALDVVGIEKSKYYEIFKIIAIILHLGNIEFSSMKAEQANFKEPATVVAELLGVSVKDFTEAILRPKVKAGRDFVKQSRNATQAKFSLDALSKSLYEKIFKFLVDAVNENLDHSSNSQNFIGVLDIAGFEIFKQNSFEQLCINYTNEKLQQFFNHHMFVLEQNEYIKEDIDWNFIDFGQDLQKSIDLIEKTQKPIGIFSVLDEESIVPNSSDASFFDKLKQYCDTESDKLKPSKFSNRFTLTHYAGDVEYSIDGWIDKNKDPLFDSVVEMLSASSNSFIASLYASDSSRRGSSFRTVSQRHKEQLNQLLQLLSETHPHFVRCIIPNHKKKAQMFDKQLILEQLKCNGVLEGIRIVRSGFPNRIFFKEFFDRYKVLSPRANFTGNLRTNCTLILNELDLDPEIYKVGSTKVFFKAGVLADLELQRDNEIKISITKFDAVARGVIKRRSINQKLARIQASQVLMKAFGTYKKLKQNPWFKLYSDLKPLLSASQQVIKTKHIGEQVKTLERKLREFDAEKERIFQQHEQELREKEKVLEELTVHERELQSELLGRQSLISGMEKERDSFKKAKEELDEMLKAYEEDLGKGKQLIEVLEKDKLQLSSKVAILESSLKESECLQKSLNESSAKIDEELGMLRSLLKLKEEHISKLEAEVAQSDNVLEEKMSSLNSSYSIANSKVKELIDQNKTLSNNLKALQDSSAQFEIVVSKKQNELDHMKDLLRRQSDQIRQLQKERDSLKNDQKSVNADLKAARAEVSSLRKKHQQLEHEAREASDLLQRKISDEVTFSRGRQQHEMELASLRAQIDHLQSELSSEKDRTLNFVKQVRELKIEVEDAHKDRKIQDVSDAQGAFRTRSLNYKDSDMDRIRDDKELLIRDYASVKLQLNEQSAVAKRQSIENSRLKADLKMLHSRLASETFDKQQLKIKLNRIQSSLSKGETPEFEDDEYQKLLNQVSSLRRDLDLERRASQRAIEGNQRRALTDRNSLVPLPAEKSDSYKAKFEESQAKLRLLGRKLADKSSDEYLKSGVLIQEKSTLTAKHDEELLNAYQETSRCLDIARKDNVQAESRITQLEVELTEAKETIEKYKNKDGESLSNHLAREELSKTQLKLETVETKNAQLSKSVKLYKERAEEYFSKLESAEAAIRNARHAEKFVKEQYEEAKDNIAFMKRELVKSETAAGKLNHTISELREALEGRDSEVTKLQSVNHSLQEEITNYHTRMMKSSHTLKARLESQINKLNDDLTISLRSETELRKTIGSLEVEYQRLEEQKTNEIKELIKERTYFTRMANDLKEENEMSAEAQKDLEMKLRSLMSQISKLNESVDSLIKERDLLESDKKRLESKIQSMTGEYKNYESERQLLEQGHESLKLSIAKYEDQVESLKKDYKKSLANQEKLNDVIDDGKRKVIILTEENQSLGKYAESLKSRITEMEKKQAANHDEVWKERISLLETKLEAESEEKAHECMLRKGLERTIDELRTKADKQHTQITGFDDERAKYENKISELFHAITKWQTADSTSRLNIKRAEREIRHLQEHSMELEQELNEWKMKFDAISTRKSNVVRDEVFL